MNRYIIICALLFLMSSISYSSEEKDIPDSVNKAQYLLHETKVKASEKSIEITIRNVDISKFPEINIIVEAFNNAGEPLDSLSPKGLTVLENGEQKPVISVNRISVKERVPVDFIFIIDVTGSMQKFIDQMKNYLTSFTTSLIRRGIDYRLGLILFSDYVDKTYQPTDNVMNFLAWLNPVKSAGGGDEKENALEALKEASKLKFRPSANRVGILITDAPYHQRGEKGDGQTLETQNTIIDLLNKTDFRLFSIVPPRLFEYKQISTKTRGKAYDIEYPFSTILDNFSNQLTNLFALKYRTDQAAIPDSINIALINEKKLELVRKTIPIVELGRKLIIENLLYDLNSSLLPDSVSELEVLKQFMANKPNVIIMVEGHTDDRGSHQLNNRLSLQRAESVKKYLVSRGITASRIKTVGFGKRKPIAANDTDFGRRLNRRTEIVIVAK